MKEGGKKERKKNRWKKMRRCEKTLLDQKESRSRSERAVNSKI